MELELHPPAEWRCPYAAGEIVVSDPYHLVERIPGTVTYCRMTEFARSLCTGIPKAKLPRSSKPFGAGAQT